MLIVLLPVGMLLGGALQGDTSAFEGGFTWQSAFYSVVEPIMGLGISYALLVSFRLRRNGAPTRMTAWLSANAFLVYILQAIVVTYVGFGLRQVPANPLLKFVITGCIALVLCFTLASLIRRIPGVKKLV